MLYKLVGNNLTNPPETLRANGKVIVNFNKSEKLQTLYGYKPVVDGDIPECDPETEYIDHVGYTETDEAIVKVYEVKLLADKPVVEPIEPTPTLEERVLKLEDDITTTQVAVAEVFELVEGGEI